MFIPGCTGQNQNDRASQARDSNLLNQDYSLRLQKNWEDSSFAFFSFFPPTMTGVKIDLQLLM